MSGQVPVGMIEWFQREIDRLRYEIANRDETIKSMVTREMWDRLAPSTEEKEPAK